jgi:hypothetical protein
LLFQNPLPPHLWLRSFLRFGLLILLSSSNWSSISFRWFDLRFDSSMPELMHDSSRSVQVIDRFFLSNLMFKEVPLLKKILPARCLMVYFQVAWWTCRHEMHVNCLVICSCWCLWIFHWFLLLLVI